MGLDVMCEYEFHIEWYISDGQLGFKSSHPQISEPTRIDGLEEVEDIAAGGSHSLFLLTDGRVMSCGKGCYGQLGKPSQSSE